MGASLCGLPLPLFHARGQRIGVDDVDVVGGAREGDEEVAGAVAQDFVGFDQNDRIELETLGCVGGQKGDTLG